MIHICAIKELHAKLYDLGIVLCLELRQSVDHQIIGNYPGH